MDDLISRQVAIDAIDECFKKVVRARNMSAYEYDSAYAQGEIDAYVAAIDTLKTFAPVQPEPSEITDEQAILHLQSTGWMQNHDREIYESGLKERLADDSESYDSLIPYEDDGDTISRRAAVDVVDFECGEWRGLAKTIIKKLEALHAVQPERVCVATVTLTDEQVKEAVEKAKNAVISVIEPEPHWIPCSEKMPSETVIATVETKVFKHRYVCEAVWVPRWTWKASFDAWEDCSEYKEDDDEYYVLEGWYERVHNWDEYAYVAIDDNVIAWMPMPIPYEGG